MDPLKLWTLLLSLSSIFFLSVHELVLVPWANVEYYSLSKKQLTLRAWMTIPVTFTGWASMVFGMFTLNKLFGVFDSHKVTELTHDEGYIKNM